MAFAYAVTTSIGKVGNILNGWITPGLENKWGLGYTFLIGEIFCLLSLEVAVALVLIDKYADKFDP